MRFGQQLQESVLDCILCADICNIMFWSAQVWTDQREGLCCLKLWSFYVQLSKIGGWHQFSTYWRLCDWIGKFNPVDKHCWFSSPLCWLSPQHFDHMNLHICSTCLFNGSNLLLEICTGLWSNTHDPSYCWSKSMSKTKFCVWWQQLRYETDHNPQEHMSDLLCNVNCMYQVHWRSQLRYKWAMLLLMHDYTPLHGDVLTLKHKTQ
jgi:hypothetical protein